MVGERVTRAIISPTLVHHFNVYKCSVGRDSSDSALHFGDARIYALILILYRVCS